MIDPGFIVPVTGGRHARHRHDVPDVARRADHRARPRQRHFADHFRRHRGRLAACDRADAGAGAHRGDASSLRCSSASPSLVVLVTAFVVFVERGQRKILVNYAKRQVGNKVYGGQSSHLPLKLNMAGVIPPIFAQLDHPVPGDAVRLVRVTGENMIWLKDLAATLGARAADLRDAVRRHDHILLLLLHRAAVQPEGDRGQPEEERCLHPGLYGRATRPRATSRRSLMRLTLVGALYVTLVCLLPEFLIAEMERAVLLRRNVAPDHRGRDDGFHGAGAGLRDVAPVRKPAEKANFKAAEDCTARLGQHGKGRNDYRCRARCLEMLPNATFRVKLENGHVVFGAYFGKDANALHPHFTRATR